MSQLVIVQSVLFLRMLFNGICFGCVYDCLRAFRRVIRHRNIFVALEDFFFSCVIIAQTIYLLQIYLLGNIRYFVVLGVLLGVILYAYTISSVWISLIYHILLTAKKCSKNIKKMLKKVAKTVNIMVNLEKYHKHEK